MAPQGFEVGHNTTGALVYKRSARVFGYSHISPGYGAFILCQRELLAQCAL